MKYLLVVFCVALALCGCGDGLPNVSNIAVDVKVRRFDKAFFAVDTTQMENSLNELNRAFPDFFPGFLTNILGINPSDPQAVAAIKAFVGSYKAVYNLGNKVA